MKFVDFYQASFSHVFHFFSFVFRLDFVYSSRFVDEHFLGQRPNSTSESIFIYDTEAKELYAKTLDQRTYVRSAFILHNFCINKNWKKKMWK